MALEHQPAQAQQRGAVVAAVIQALLQRRQHRVGADRAQLGQQIAAELLTHELHDHLRQPFAGLEGDVADEAIAHHDVGRALEDVVALDVADEVEVARGSGRAQQLAGALDLVAALDRLFADVEQAHRRALFALQHRHQRRPHDGELQQVLCRAVDVGTQVEHGGGAALGIGHLRGDGGALDAVQRLEQVARNRHQRTRVARGDRRLRRAVLHLLDGHAHGRVLLAAQGDLNRVVHGDDFGGRHHACALMGKAGQRGGLAHQDQLRIRPLIQKLATGRQGSLGTMVSPHAVNGQNDHARTSKKPRRHSAATPTSRPRNTKGPGLHRVAPGLAII